MNTTLFWLTLTFCVWSLGAGYWPATASAIKWEKPLVSWESDSYKIMGVPDDSNFVEVRYEEVPQWVHRALQKHCHIAGLVRAWVGMDDSYIVEFCMVGMGRAVYYVHLARW